MNKSNEFESCVGKKITAINTTDEGVEILLENGTSIHFWHIGDDAGFYIADSDDKHKG